MIRPFASDILHRPGEPLSTSSRRTPGPIIPVICGWMKVSNIRANVKSRGMGPGSEAGATFKFFYAAASFFGGKRP
jgi:hypothetical protein